MLGRRHNPNTQIHIGFFWYPKNFYEILDHHLLALPLRQFCEGKNINEVYEFLSDVREYRATRTWALYEKYIGEDAVLKINISDERRAQVEQYLESTTPELVKRNIHQFRRFPAARTHRGVLRDRPDKKRWYKKQGNPIFEGCKSDTVEVFLANYTNHNSEQSFWQCPMFLAVHKYRTSNMYKFWKKKQPERVDAISNAAFQEFLATSNTNGDIAEMAARFGVTKEEFLKEFEDAYNY